MGLPKKKRILIKKLYGKISTEELSHKIGLQKQEVIQAAMEMGLESSYELQPAISFNLLNHLKLYLFPLIILITSGVLIYANTLEGDFIYDDEVIAETEEIHANTLSQIPRVLFSESTVSMDRKVGMLSFAINYYFNGLDPYGYHLVNMFIHLVNGFLLYLLVRLTLKMSMFNNTIRDRAEPIALAGSLLWLVHPVQTQAVTYIIQRFTSMAALFFLLSLLFYAYARVVEDRKRFVFYFLAILSGLLALGTKQISATLPVVILLYEIFFLKGIHIGWNKKSITAIAGIILIMAGLSYAFLSVESLSSILKKFQDRGLTPWENLLTEARVLVYYVSLLIFPHPSRLRLDYDIVISRGLFNPPTTAISIIILSALFGIALWKAKKNALLSFSILWFFLNLLIESTILPLDLVYEHRLYVPSMALLVYTAGSLITVEDKTFKSPSFVFLIVIVVLFSYWTRERNYIWQDAVTLWKDNVKKSPNKARVRGNLGMAYIAARDYENALIETQKAIELDPDMMGAYLNLSAIYMDYYKDYDKATQSLKELLKRFPGNTAAIHNLGIIKMRQNNFPEAIKLFKQVLEKDKGSPLVYYNLSSAYISSNDYNNALSTLTTAVTRWPFHSELNGLLGIAYFKVGEWEKAKVTLQRAVQLGSQNPKVEEYFQALEMDM